MLTPIKIGISSCLLGHPVRYDGGWLPIAQGENFPPDLSESPSLELKLRNYY
jgi:hypothetical protein